MDKPLTATELKRHNAEWLAQWERLSDRTQMHPLDPLLQPMVDALMRALNQPAMPLYRPKLQ